MKLGTIIAILAAAWGVSTAAQASDAYPNQPLKIIVPYQPGSSPDATMRFLGQQLAELLKQPVIIDNRPGAGGLIGGDALAKAKPDGYTLGYLSNQHLLHPHMLQKMPYDPLTAFSMVAMMGRNAQILMVPPSHPANDLKEYLEAARAKSGTVKFGSGGIGSPAHLAGQIFAKQAGLQAVHVPYKGAPEAVTALMGGHVDYVIVTAGVATPLIKSGKAKALAVTSKTRHPVFPNLPTLAESMPDGLVLEPWSVVAAPAGTPRAVTEKLNQAFSQVLKDKRTVEYYASLGGEIVLMSPKETEEFYRMDASRLDAWAPELGLKKQ